MDWKTEYTAEYIADETIPFIGELWQRYGDNEQRMLNGCDPTSWKELDRYKQMELAHLFRIKNPLI